MEQIKDINILRDWFQDIAHEIHFLKMGILAGYKQEELEKMCVSIRGKCLAHETELFKLEQNAILTTSSTRLADARGLTQC
jgi:hypothetical protein